MPSRIALTFLIATTFLAPAHAGLKACSDISFYLRSLISAHHDTLAVKVK